MALANDVRKCVVFIGHGEDDRFKACGTAFLLNYGGSRYLVTARHVAQGLADDPFAIRINKKEGDASDTYEVDPLEKQHDWFRWFFPNDPTVDVAVIPFNFAFTDDCDIKTMAGEDWVMDDALRAEEEIGPGDICYAVGLFKLVQGRARNVPIVHTGRIALSAGEDRIPVEDWNDRSKTVEVRGHLVELTNLEGLSGAPVFVRSELMVGKVPFPSKTRDVLLTDARMYLFGIWQGSWNHHVHDARRPLAMGVVVPASDLLTLLEQEDVKATRTAHNEYWAQQRAARLD